MFYLIIWVCLFLMVAAFLLPILRVFGIVDWSWKVILAPIWAPMLAILAVFIWFIVPILIASFFIVMMTGSTLI